MYKKLFRSEEGSVSVFVALTMTVLLGVASLAVDYGSLTNERSLLQNAADAAALAGVVEGEAIAKTYVMNNTSGVAEGEIQVVKPTEDTMKVTVQKEVPAYFSQILTGNSTNTVSASATAKFGGEILAPGYAIWAEDEINLKNKSTIEGSIHSNTENFNFKEEQVKITGERTHDHQSMPDYSYLKDGAKLMDLNLCEQKKKQIVITATAMAGLDKDTIYYINDSREVVISGPLDINVIADGDIVFNGSGASVDAKVLYSVNGDVTLNGSGGVLNVLVYAPSGNVTWNGANSSLRGAIIAQNFIENGAEASVVYDENVVGKFPKLVPFLIE